MKTRTIKFLGLLTGVALLTFLVEADNPCVNQQHYGPWTCVYPGNIIAVGTLTWNNTNICPGATLAAPKFVTNPTFTNGLKQANITNTCPGYPTVANSSVTYSAGSLYFIPGNTNWPPVSGPFTNSGTFTYTAMFDGIPAGGVCATNYGITNGMVTVTVSAPISITQQPSNQMVSVEGTASFTVAVNGTVPSYQWYFNTNTSLIGATNATLTLTNVQTTNAGSYRVQITNPVGTLSSSNAILTVNAFQPPVITIPPANQTVVAGGTAIFSVAVCGTSPFIYQWQFNSVNLPNDVITTVAGNDIEGYSGDNGQATAASLWSPYSVAVDTSGNLYIADTYNYCIRKVDTNGVITTVAGGGSQGLGDGGQATNADLNEPTGVAVDAAGNLFIADFLDNRIRKVNTSGIITTVAGKGARGDSGDNGLATNATMYLPRDVAVDTFGNLFIADTGNNVIREVNTSGIIITVAGGANNGLGDGGVATNASLIWPSGLAVDGSGNLFIADTINNRIRDVLFGSYPSLTLKNVTTNNAGNYTVVITNPYGSVTSAPPALLTVLVPPLITTQPTNTTVTYGQQATFFVQATGTAPLQYQWKRYGTNIPGATSSWYSVSKPAVADSGAIYSVIVSNACGTATSSNATLMVVKAPLTIRADNKAKIYSQTNPPLTWSVLGLVYGDGTNVLAGTPVLSTTASNTSPAGNYTITITNGTLSASNYVFTFANGILSVVKAPLGVTADNQTRTYGTANPSLTWHITGLVNGETTNVLSGAPQIGTVATNGSPAGVYPITITSGTLSATNYSFGFVNGTLTVTRAALTVTANSTNRVYGVANPVFTARYSGFVNGDTPNVLSGSPLLTTAAVSNSQAGNYTITNTIGTLYASNYNFTTFNNGTLTVSQANLTVLADNKTMYVGEAIPPLTWTFNGLVAGDTTNVISGAPTLSTVSSVSSTNTYNTITNTLGNLGAANYTFILSNGILTVLPPSSQIAFSSNSVMNYLIGAPPMVMDANMTVTNKGTTSFGSAKLTARFVYGEADDHLSVLNLGTAAGQVGVTNAPGGSSDPYVITYGTGTGTGTTNIGTFTPGNFPNDLVVHFGTNATLDHVRAVARNMTFCSTSRSPSGNWRHVQCSVTTTNSNPAGTNVSTSGTNTIEFPCPTNICAFLVIDRTPSMGTMDMGTTNIYGSNRLAAAKAAAISFLGYMQFPTDTVSIVTFSDRTNTTSNPILVTNFCTDRIGASNTIATIVTNVNNGTIYFPSLHCAYTNLAGLTNPFTLRLAIFLSDGEENGTDYGVQNSKQLALNEAHAMATNGVPGTNGMPGIAGIRLITIGVGGEVAKNDDVGTNARALLIKMASSTNDFYVSTNGAGLASVYNGIASSICRVTNLPPVVYAGPDTTNVFGTLPGTVTLTGSMSDDGLPAPPQLTNLWTIISGPAGGAALTSPTNTNTTVTVTLPGVYVFQLLASDTQLSATDTVTNTIRELPAVAITNPPPSAVFLPGTNILIQARAASRDGGVSKVEFFHGDVSIGFIANASPIGTNGYSVTWTNVPPGNYALTAVATDTNGLTSTSSTIYITVLGPPTIYIATPLAGDTFNALATLRLTSVVRDTDGVVTNVDYYTNGVWCGRSTASSAFPLILNNVLGSTNQIQLTAVATDNNGVTATSPSVNVTVFRQPPVVSILTPQSNAVFSLGEPIAIQASASDADGQIANLVIRTNGVQLSAAAANNITVIWTNAPAGSNQISAIAYDNDGLTNISAVPITVNDGCPSIAGMSNLVLSVSEIVGGGQLTGTVILSNAVPAGSGGQAVNLYSTNPAVIVPPSVYVPEGQRSNSFVISTLPVSATNVVTIAAAYHGQNPPLTKTLTVKPEIGVLNGLGSTNQSSGIVTEDLNTLSPEALVREIVGPNVTFSNVRFTGTSNAAGIFVGGNGIIGFDSGIIFSSGDIMNVIGPNTWPYASAENYVAGDSDLDRIVAPDVTHDAAVLEFDFVPSADTITWDYVFGSEEYNEYVFAFNDVFGFFLNGTNVAVLPDGTAVSIDNINNYVNTEYYRDNAQGGAGGDANNSPFNTQLDGMTTVLSVSSHVIPGITNHIKLAIADTRDYELDSVVMIRARSFKTGGAVVYMRDDQNRQYAPFEVTGMQSGGAASIPAGFDTKGTWGNVAGMRVQRAGTLQTSSGSKFDVEIGVSALSNAASSFGLLFTNAQKFTGTNHYSIEWELPTVFYSDAGAGLGGVYSLLLSNRFSSVCGQAGGVADTPQAVWPLDRDILTLAVVTDRVIPQGRCCDFLFTSGDSPLNGTWDIVFRSQVIASSGQPNGWDVEADHTTYGGFTVTAPVTAIVEQGYIVRVQPGGWGSGMSVRFTVMPSNSIPSAPVLLPLLLSTNTISSSTSVTLTVALDAPAPLGDAYVTLRTNGFSGCVAPPWVVIPAGQRFTATNLQVNGGAIGTVEILAEYNGYRKAKVQVVSGCTTPLQPGNLTATDHPVDSTVVLAWDPVANATSYSISSSTNGVVFVPLFSGLTTNRFVDTVLARPNVYYYQVTAFSNWCASTPASCSVNVAMPYNTPVPWIIPSGGIFNDSVDVLITNFVAGTTIYYTTNGDTPGWGSDSFINGGVITLSSNASVQAFANNSSYSDKSRVVSANFVVVHPTPIHCGDTLPGSLTHTNAYCTLAGPGCYSSRYVYTATNGDVGQFVSVTAASSDFDTVLLLEDGSGNLLDWNLDPEDRPSVSQITFRVPGAGNYIFEVTSYWQDETGNFTVHLDCSSPVSAGLNVFTNACTNGVTHFTTNSAILPIGGLIDFGTISANTRVTNWVTLTNGGNGNLVISNIVIAPAAATNGGNGFSIWPTNVITLLPGGITNLAVSLFATNWFGFDGYFSFQSNDAGNGNDTPQNFFYAYISGLVALAGPPWVNIYFPTNGMAVPVTNSYLTNVTVEIDVEAMDEDGIKKIEFYTNNPPQLPVFRTVYVWPYTIYWTNPPAGQWTITAMAYDNSIPQQTATTNVWITVGFPTLTLSPTNACVGLSNTTFTVTATLLNATNGLVSGSYVTFTVTGAHNLTYSTNTLAGVATLTYTGTNAGLDTITATVTLNGVPVQSNPVLKNWARPISCGNVYNGILTNTDGTSIACQCDYPSHYTDFYSLSGASNDLVLLRMTSTNFPTFLFVMAATNCSKLNVTNEMLNLNDVQARVTLPSNGTYIVEATSADPFRMGSYSLSVTCNVTPTAPRIAVSVNGASFANYGLLNLGTTTNGTPLTRLIGITNLGNAPLVLTNYAWYYGQSNVFSVTLAPGVSLAAGTGTNFTLQFSSTNSGQYQDALILTNSDPDKPLFVINLNAISNPNNTNGSAPTVTLTAPPNNAAFTAPASITLSATATPSGAGVTITNVEFGYWNGQGWYLIGRDTSGPNYSTVWNTSTPGAYTLAAAAWDSLGRMAFSPSVTNVQVRLSTNNHSPKAVTDTVTVLCNSHNNVLDVLTNDTDPDGDPLTIINYKLSTLLQPHGVVKIVDNGKHLSYTPPPFISSSNNAYPADGFSYEIGDGKGGTNWGSVFVIIYGGPMPHIQITNPPVTNPPWTIQAGTTNYVKWTNWPAEALSNIVRIEFYDKDIKIGEVTNNLPSTNWPWVVQYDSCQCGLKARVIDKFGQFSEDTAKYTIVPPTDPNLPTPYASISSPAVLSKRPQVPDDPERNAEVTDGMLVVAGSVYQATNGGPHQPVPYKVLIKTPDGAVLRDSGWQPPADIEYGPIYTNDLTTLQNDSYVMELVAQNDYRIAHDEVPFLLNTGLKLGVFTFSEQDLVIPAGGAPLSVIRTYNSMNPIAGDFGYSWTYALQELNVAFHEDRTWVKPDEEDIDDVGPAGNGVYFSMRTGGSRDITLTLPSGQRVTFYYYETPGGLGYAEPHYYVPPEAHVKQFEPMNDNGNPIPTHLDLIGGYYVWTVPGGSSTYYDNFDFPAYLLTLDDGTQYFIKRGYQGTFESIGDSASSFYINKVYNDQARVAWIQLPSGEKIVINDPTTGPTSGQFSVDYFVDTNKIRSIYFLRNGNGQISAIMDPVSQLSTNNSQPPLPVIKYEYDGETNLVRVLKLQDRSGQGIYATNTYLYENGYFPHYLTKILDPRGVALARNLFDDTGKLIGVIDANGKTNLFFYDLTGQTETVFDRLGNRMTYGYDARGNVTLTIDALGRQTSRTFDNDNNVTSATDPLGNTYHYTYDANGNQTSVVDPLGHTSLIAFNGNNQPTVMTNALGAVTQFQYDDRGNQTNMVDALNNSYGVVYDANNKPTSITDPLGRVNATAVYDALGNLSNLTDTASGATTTFAYDANGNQTMSSNLWVNPTNSADVRVVASHSVYDAQGREISSTDPDGLQSSVTYDLAGRQSQLTNEYNRTSGWVYDARGSLVQISFPDNSISRMVYDDVGRMSVTDDKHLPGVIANGTRTTYDQVGQVIKSEKLTNVVIEITTDASGISSSAVTSIGGVISTSTYGYDLAGRQIAVTNGFGAVTRYEYDEAGNQTAVIDALNNRTDNVSDGAGRLITTFNPLMQITRYQYDDLGRLTRTIYPDGSFAAVAYDAAGNRVAETNQLGLVTTYTYDSASRMTNILKPVVFDPESGGPVNPQWGFAYDANGQLKSVSNPKQRMTQFTYDQLGRTLTHTLPIGQTASQMYDNFGRTWRKIDFKGQTNEFVYDSIGRLATNQFYAIGSGTPNVAAAYTYDSEDRTKQIFESRGTNAFTYDNQGHVLQVASPEGAVNYEYEPIEGRRVRTYTANSDIRYGYDLLGRISTVTVMKRDGAPVIPPEVTTNTYTALGSLQDVYYPNGVHAAYQYDVMNRLTNVVNYNNVGGILSRYQYAMGTNGVVKAVTEIRLESGGNYSTNQIAYTYDNLNRLVREASVSLLSEANYTNNYVYDLAGNLLWRTNGATGEVIAYSYNTNDQLLVESSSASGSFTNKYDTNGSLTNRASASESAAYVYDLQNRLTGATINRKEGVHSVAILAAYTNNYAGLRVRSVASETVDSGGANVQTNIFLFDTKSGGAQVLEELSSVGGVPTVSYTIGGRVLSQSKNGVVSHLLGDGHGSTRLLTGSTGAVTDRYSYDAYGKMLVFNPGVVNQPTTSALYSGEHLDRDLQQYNLQARYYNPSIGRFSAIDPFSPNQQSGANLYAYCGNDPINGSDPSGQYEVDVHRFLTQFLAREAGFTSQAEWIGRATQALDDAHDGRGASFDGTLIPNWWNMGRYHFVSKGRLQELRNAVDFNNPLYGYFKSPLGEYLHAYEDTFAHSPCEMGIDGGYYGDVTVCGAVIWGGGGIIGHGAQFHDPDHTWMEPEKALKMAKTIYGVLKDHAPAGSSPTDWSAIEGKVQAFVQYPPNVYDQYLFVQNVTFNGYNQKIKLLDSTFVLDDKYKEEFNDVLGHAPSNNNWRFGYLPTVNAYIDATAFSIASFGFL